MLKIRPDQMQLFRDCGVRRFEQRAIADLLETFPDESAEYSEFDLRELVREGISRARAHGIVTEAGMTVWLHLSIVLGKHFDAKPDLPWVASVLADSEFMSEAGRVRKLLDAAIAHLDTDELERE